MDTSFHYTTVVLRVWGWQSQKCNSKCPNETINGLFQKNFPDFYFNPENSLPLTLPPSPFLSFFLYYSVCAMIVPVCSDCNHPFDKSTFTHSLTRIHYCNWKYISEWSFFLNQKFIFFHKRNFNPKVTFFNRSKTACWTVSR